MEILNKIALLKIGSMYASMALSSSSLDFGENNSTERVVVVHTSFAIDANADIPANIELLLAFEFTHGAVHSVRLNASAL